MHKTKARWTDQQVETLMGDLLRAGVLFSALVILAGAVPYLRTFGHSAPHFKAFTGEPADLRQVPEIITGVLSLDGRAIIQLGVLLLIATPVARVAFAVVAFALQHDRLYVLVSLLVLFILTLSITGAHL